MVSVRRCRRGRKNTPDSTGRRSRRGTLYTGRRCNGSPLYTGRRSKGCVFLVSATHERRSRTRVVTGYFVERPPCDRVPARLIGAVALHSLMDEPGFDQITLGPRYHVCALPAAFGKVSSRRQQPPVVVAHKLACQLKKQSTRRMAQSSVGGAIQHAPRQGYKTACVAP